MQRRLDGYTLIEFVGVGGSGEIWRARPDDRGPEVTLTWLVDDAVEEPGTDIDRLRVARLRAFEHPHVARLLDLLRAGSGVVLVEEFVPGVSLASLLADRDRLSSAEVVTLLVPIAEGLGVAHEAGLLHGNLSPSAVVFTADGRPILTELGVRQCLGPGLGTASAPGQGAGAVARDYLDPTVARGAAPTEASDVFGLAAIGFHALTGRPPQAAGSDSPTRRPAADGDGTALSPLDDATPARLSEVIARGLADHPRRRGSARQFAADVGQALPPEPVQLPVPHAWADLPASQGATEVADRRPGTDPPAMDIAGEVRRGGSARHAAADKPRSQRVRRAAGPTKLRTAARLVPRPAVVGALVSLAILAIVIVGLGWNASKAVPAQAGAPIGLASGPGGAPGSAGAPDGAGEAEPGDGLDERAVPASAEEWIALLSVLYERRAAAFGTGAAPLLDGVFTADSPQLAADAAEVSRLVAAGQVLRGFAPSVLEILDVSVGGDLARLQITDEFGAYETVPAGNPQAAALAGNPGRGPATVAMTLVRTGDGWRIEIAQRLD